MSKLIRYEHTRLEAPWVGMTLEPSPNGIWVKWEDVQKEFERLHKVIEAGQKVLCARECGVVVPEESAIILHKFYREERDLKC